MSSPNLLAIGTGVQMLGLALTAGGMLAIGAFVAPVVFRSFPPEAAGAAMLVVFQRFDTLLLACIGLIVIGEALRLLSGLVPAMGGLPITRYVLMGALIAGLLFSVFKVNADLIAMNKAGVRPGGTEEGLRFVKTHKLSEKLYKVEMLGAALLIVLTPFVGRLNKS